MTFVASAPRESVPPPVRPHAREQVRSEGDEAVLRDLVRDAAHPVRETEDLVNHDDDPGLLLLLGVDDPREELAAARKRDVHPLAVARRLRERVLGLSVVGWNLREHRGRDQGESEEHGLHRIPSTRKRSDRMRW